MNVKNFDAVLPNVPAGNSSSTHLEDQLNSFRKPYPIQVAATHMTTMVVPGEPASVPGAEANQPSVILFATLFYQ